MSEQSPRDTQFAGFAKLLYEQFVNAAPIYVDGHVRRGTMSREEVEQIIAQRAYDLVTNACVDISNAQIKQGVRLHFRAMLRSISDMTEWRMSNHERNQV